ncbi:hypothetical protein ACFL45_04185 [Candidatus Neomarinimicrobiota bacterium]
MAVHKTYKKHSSALQLLLFVLVFIAGYTAPLRAGRPEIALQGAFVYPRADLSTDESITTWAQVAIRHQLSKKIGWNLLGDATGPTITRPEGMRIYSGSIQLQFAPHFKLALGRHAQWNSLHTARFDGLQTSIRKNSTAGWQELTIYAGLVPTMEYHNDQGDDNTLAAGAMLKRVRKALRYTVQVWTNEMGGESRIFFGGSLRRPIGARITQVADLAVDLQNSVLEKLRLRSHIRLSSKLGSYVQYRHSGSLTFAPYPWSEEALAPRQAFSAGIDMKLARKSQVRASVNQRLGESSGTYLSVRYLMGGLQFVWMSQSQTTYGGQVLQLSGQQTLFKKLTLGGSIGNNTYTLYERNDPGIKDADRSALGGSLWIQGFLGQHLNYRLFAQYSQNRYFEQDGRIGLQVGYAL